MFPFGIFPFNVMPMFSNPWFPLQAKEGQPDMPPMMKAYMEGWLAWSAMMSQTPWMASYSAMLENNPFLTPPSGGQKKK